MTLYKVIRFLKCSEKSCKWSKILYHEEEWDLQIYFFESCHCNGKRKERILYYLAKTVAILSAIAGES